ncbi:MAG: hypothetical protein ATN31_07175 [Candidatus Epulonipiscioides saccharophilum]|nr:MAG: hypothetical protein ATN31_07175 [Epulopiscium sp. AS2M-Bin001]
MAKKFEFTSLNHTKLTDGFWGRRTENYQEIIDSMLEALLNPTNSARLLNFEIAAGELNAEFFGAHWSDGDCYKFLEGCCYIYQNTGDEKVKEMVQKYAKLIAKSQEEDGYICTQITLTDKKRWERYDFHELYNMGHLFTLAVAYFDAFQDKLLIKVANKLADYLYNIFSSYPKDLLNFGFNPSNIMGLCDLYRITGIEKQYKLAEIFVNMRGMSQEKDKDGIRADPTGKARKTGNFATDQNQTLVPLREETMATGHAVTSSYLYSGATDVYSITGEKALLDALERIYTDLTTKRIYITGGTNATFVGHSERGSLTHESHGTEYELPNKIAYNETCANIGAAMWCLRMLQVTEDTKYGDMAERIMYNAGISGTNLELTRYFYSNPLSYKKDTPIPGEWAQYKHKSSRRWHTYTCWCCPPQLLRTIAGIGRWVYGISKDTLYINMFTSSDYKDGNLDVSMKTNYPFEEKVELKINHATNQRLKIRIPVWCDNPSINDTPVKSGYYELEVNSGDEFTIDLPMKAKFMQANPHVESDRGMTCVMRGPVVYAAEGIDNKYSLDELFLYTDREVLATYEKDLLAGVVTLEVPAKHIPQKSDLYYEIQTDGEDTTVKMIPYYAWANRELCDMNVWFAKA